RRYPIDYQLFTLIAWDGLDHREAASRLGISRIEVKNRMQDMRPRVIELIGGARPRSLIRRIEWLEVHYGPLDGFIAELAEDHAGMFDACYRRQLGYRGAAAAAGVRAQLVTDRMLAIVDDIEAKLLQDNDALLANSPSDNRHLTEW